jgi:deoxyribodipyrimidine photo-lyase
MPATVVWLRNDLRLGDHPALHYAAQRGAVVPVFVWAPDEEQPWAPGGASRWWLHESLARLAKSLSARGLRLVLLHGPAADALLAAAGASGADEVAWNTRYAPPLAERDRAVRAALESGGVGVRQFAAQLLHDPDAVQTTSGGPYRVFTPFWRKVSEGLNVAPPLPVPRLGARLAPARWPESAPLASLGLSPLQQDGVDWAGEMRRSWRPGEDGAAARLAALIDDRLAQYSGRRDRPDLEGTSALSPHLHHGEISPRQVWHALAEAAPRGDSSADTFRSQLGWREFSYHVLHHHPRSPTEPLREKYAAFPWRSDDEALARWRRGRTGYPLVDAGMRQLWATGWMHNRVRMVVASFLCKHLLLPWQLGAEWFWDTLVDADLANNTMGWQWAAGCGADAQPFIRIFNPITQSQKFDPDGSYIRRWVPEIAMLPAPLIHTPWNAPPDLFLDPTRNLATPYPSPLVDHRAGRQRALDAFAQLP